MTSTAKPSRYLPWIAALAAAAAILWLLFGQTNSAEAPKAASYDPAALSQLLTATLPDIATGEAKKLADWHGKPLVINFWASWCPPCQRELPDFAAVARHYGNRVHFVGIGLDERQALLNTAHTFALPYPTLVGGGFVLGQTVRLGNPTRGLPFTLVLDSRGNPVTHHVGAMSRAALEAAIERALAATP